MTPTSRPHQALLRGADDRPGVGVAAFVTESLLRGEAAVVIATQAHRAEVAEALAGAGVRLGRARSEGRYVELDAATTLSSLRSDAGVDPARFGQAVDPLLGALTNRFGAVAAYGEMVGLLAEEGDLVGAMQLESLWEPRVRSRPLQLLCGYPHGSLDPAAAGRVEQVHHAVAPPVDDVWATALEDGVQSVPVARTALLGSACAGGAGLPGLADDLADDLALVTAELLGNAVRHGARPGPAPVPTLCVQRHGDAVRVSVTDGSQALPVPREDLLAEGGRGYLIISALAADWGVELLPVGKRVWATLGSADAAA